VRKRERETDEKELFFSLPLYHTEDTFLEHVLY
jgi:hypothetical protein